MLRKKLLHIDTAVDELDRVPALPFHVSSYSYLLLVQCLFLLSLVSRITSLIKERKYYPALKVRSIASFRSC